MVGRAWSFPCLYSLGFVGGYGGTDVKEGSSSSYFSSSSSTWIFDISPNAPDVPKRTRKYQVHSSLIMVLSPFVYLRVLLILSTSWKSLKGLEQAISPTRNLKSLRGGPQIILRNGKRVPILMHMRNTPQPAVLFDHPSQTHCEQKRRRRTHSPHYDS